MPAADRLIQSLQAQPLLIVLRPGAPLQAVPTLERLQALGLIHVLVEDNDGLAKEAERIVQQVFTCAPGAIDAAKDLIRVVEGRPIDAGLRAETSRRIAERRASDEAKEGLSAFLQKRKPRWAE